MAYIIKDKLDRNIKEVALKILLSSITSINSVGKLRNFLNKFLTSDEQILLLRRVAVIELIDQGKTYRKIKEILKTSSRTISGVKDILSGAGYNRRNKKKKYSSSGARKIVSKRKLYGASKLVFKRSYRS